MDHGFSGEAAAEVEFRVGVEERLVPQDEPLEVEGEVNRNECATKSKIAKRTEPFLTRRNT
ncbi:hypothetical protein [Streptomyces sp. NPDC007020]|uniref:hypothetical protein n=1 Tax=Streptomyces sp. NPDC007020 TaxID=3154585 RepID=UPI0033CB2FA8